MPERHGAETQTALRFRWFALAKLPLLSETRQAIMRRFKSAPRHHKNDRNVVFACRGRKQTALLPCGLEHQSHVPQACGTDEVVPRPRFATGKARVAGKFTLNFLVLHKL